MTQSHPVALHLHFHTSVACHNRNISVAHHMLGHSTRCRRGVTAIQMSTFHLVKMWTTKHQSDVRCEATVIS